MGKDRANYLPAPHAFNLNLACVPLMAAFDGGAYLVGSCLERPDYRDVDIRVIISDAEWARLFGTTENGSHSALWSVMCAGLSAWLHDRTGLPIDFQIQQRTAANKQYGTKEHPRHALGIALEYVGGITDES